jgi:type IV secretory pathway VirB10-like protein
MFPVLVTPSFVRTTTAGSSNAVGLAFKSRKAPVTPPGGATASVVSEVETLEEMEVSEKAQPEKKPKSRRDIMEEKKHSKRELKEERKQSRRDLQDEKKKQKQEEKRKRKEEKQNEKDNATGSFVSAALRLQVKNLLVVKAAETTIDAFLLMNMDKEEHFVPRQEFSRTDICPNLITALGQNMHSVDFSCKALYLMVTLSFFDNDCFKDGFIHEGAIPAILKTMNKYPLHEDCQLFCCQALRNLANNTKLEGAKRLVTRGGIDAILHAMSNCPDDKEVQAHGAGALMNIVVHYPTSAKELIAKRSVESVIGAMQQHDRTPAVQKSGLGFLLNLVKNDPTDPNANNDKSSSSSTSKPEETTKQEEPKAAAPSKTMKEEEDQKSLGEIQQQHKNSVRQLRQEEKEPSQKSVSFRLKEKPEEEEEKPQKEEDEPALLVRIKARGGHEVVQDASLRFKDKNEDIEYRATELSKLLGIWHGWAELD